MYLKHIEGLPNPNAWLGVPWVFAEVVSNMSWDSAILGGRTFEARLSESFRALCTQSPHPHFGGPMPQLVQEGISVVTGSLFGVYGKELRSVQTRVSLQFERESLFIGVPYDEHGQHNPVLMDNILVRWQFVGERNVSERRLQHKGVCKIEFYACLKTAETLVASMDTHYRQLKPMTKSRW